LFGSINYEHGNVSIQKAFIQHPLCAKALLWMLRYCSGQAWQKFLPTFTFVILTCEQVISHDQLTWIKLTISFKINGIFQVTSNTNNLNSEVSGSLLREKHQEKGFLSGLRLDPQHQENGLAHSRGSVNTL
jgi:hypothetical protein